MKPRIAYFLIALFAVALVMGAAGCATRKNTEVRERIEYRDSISYVQETIIDTVYVPERSVSGQVHIDDLKRDTSRTFTGKDIRATVRYIDNYIEVECNADSLMQLLISTREKLYKAESVDNTSTSVTEKTITVKVWPWRLILALSAVIVVLVLILYFNNSFKKFISWIRK